MGPGWVGLVLKQQQNKCDLDYNNLEPVIVCEVKGSKNSKRQERKRNRKKKR